MGVAKFIVAETLLIEWKNLALAYHTWTERRLDLSVFQPRPINWTEKRMLPYIRLRSTDVTKSRCEVSIKKLEFAKQIEIINRYSLDTR